MLYFVMFYYYLLKACSYLIAYKKRNGTDNEIGGREELGGEEGRERLFRLYFYDKISIFNKGGKQK